MLVTHDMGFMSALFGSSKKKKSKKSKTTKTTGTSALPTDEELHQLQAAEAARQQMIKDQVDFYEDGLYHSVDALRRASPGITDMELQQELNAPYRVSQKYRP